MLAYPLAYLYLRLIWNFEHLEYAWIMSSVFCLVFIVWNELVLRGRKEKTDKRAYFWYVIMLATSLTANIAPSMGLSFFAIHLGAVYSVLISNNVLVEGKTGELIWFDLLNGFFVKTFPNMGNILTDIKELKTKPEMEEVETPKKRSFTWIVPVLIIVPFFFIAMALLSNINETFGDITEAIFEHLNFFKYLNANMVAEIIMRLIFAIPTCFFLYALASSSAISNGEKERTAGDRCKERAAKRRTVSSIVMGIMTGCFVAMYLLFFAVEFTYIFSGLMGRLPEGFNVVDYARRGFFELVGIMAINMFVFVIINTFEKKVAGKRTISGYLMIALMVESILFAVVSLSKLLMYFTKFGYTPKRMLAMWGTVILATAAVVVIISIIKGKAHARAWIVITACSYVLMCILSGVLIAVDYHGDAGISMRDEYIIYIDNYGDLDVTSLTLYADGEMVYSVSNADESALIPSGNGSYTLIIKSDDLPEGSTLKDSEFRIEFYTGEELYNNYVYEIYGEREEEDVSRTVEIRGYGVRSSR
ncbi:protein of unknown function [Ruminococcaceae bacterium KH2T8]|nr:protein of unknown function [Ruminococcaceae bacterium KH2T8]